MSRFLLFLSLSACSGDPRDDPAMQPPIQGELVLTASDASGPLGGPILVPLHVEGPGIYGHREVMTHPGTVQGRGTYDSWTVAPAEGVTDPSPWWEDQMDPPKSRHLMLTPDKPVDLKVRLDASVRFPRPGTYAAQLTTIRGKDRVRSAPVQVQVQPAGDLGARANALFEKIDATRADEQSQAFVDLALLGAPSSIPRAIERLGHPNQGSRWSLVLHAHPDREAATRALDEAIAAPDVAVHSPMIEARTALCYNQRFERPILLPDRSQAERHKQALERQVRDEAAKRCWAETAAAVADAAGSKDEAARGITYATLLRHRAVEDEPPAWADEIAQGAAASIETIQDQAVLRAWLGKPQYRSNLDAQALVEPLARMAEQPDVRGDLALKRLNELVPAKAAPIAAARFAHPTPLVLEDVAWILHQTQPEASHLDQLMQAVDTTDLLRLRLAARFAQPRHAGRWAALYDGLPDDVKTDVLGAVVAGLANAGHARARQGLDRYGPDHPLLLNEVALSVRDVGPLLERAVAGLPKDFEISRGAGEVLAEHAPASMKARLFALAKRIDGPGEFGASTALTTARAWTLTLRELNEMGRTFQHTSAIAFAKAQDHVEKPVMVMNALEVHGRPAIRFNSRVYVGEDAILAKLRQLQPSKGVKFGFEGIDALENQPRFEAFLTEAGLAAFREE